MDPLTGALVMGGGALLGNVGGALVGANQSSINARENRDWQERMANSAYQRSVTDMRAAGLNPGLMFGSGGAADTPSGAVAMAPDLSQAGTAFSSSASSFLDTAQRLAQLDATIKNTDANTKKVVAEAAKVDSEIGNAASAQALQRSQARAADASAQSAEIDRKLKKSLINALEGFLGDSVENSARGFGRKSRNAFGLSLGSDLGALFEDAHGRSIGSPGYGSY